MSRKVGMKKKEKCPNKALYAVPWGGKILMSCKVHANSMACLAQAMGSPMDIKAVHPNENCEHPNDLEMYEKAKSNQSTKEQTKEL